MKVLVAGGAGYIGSHAIKQLLASGHEPIALDNLYRGHRAAVPHEVPLVEADINDTELVAKALEQFEIDCVMHFCALTYVGESVERPLDYYHNNVAGMTSLLRAMKETAVRRLVFSSTCATYGEPVHMPITETTPQQPINPYGRSKLMCERILADELATDENFAYVALRYFNVAGCAADGSIGEDHDPETHIIPVILQTALGRREKITIFGDDYPTPDGTCIRDYVHVEDLSDAHILVMEQMQPGWGRKYNLGIGAGYSVREVIDAAKRVTNTDIPVETGPRRPGDPPSLYADPALIAEQLGWKAKITDLDRIIETAWAWFQNHPDGYAD